MSAFSERVEGEDEEDRIGMLKARAAYDKVNMQLQIEEDVDLGTCQKCGSYWDRKEFKRCPMRWLRHLPPCGGYIG